MSYLIDIPNDEMPATLPCTIRLVSFAYKAMNPSPKLRSPVDRIRQVLLFEIGGLLLITPPFVWASGVSATDSLGLLAVIALIAALWNAGYNTSFDWIEGRLTGRTADRRPYFMRMAQAAGFEGGLILISLPIVMAWTSMGLIEALLADIGLALCYVVYAFFFNLGYDRVFPIDTGA
jgi:uncharacterized membrane protein